MSIDHSPIECSIAIERGTGAVQLRYTGGAQAEESTVEAYQNAALDFSKKIQAKYPEVCLERNLFFPSGALGQMAAWHSFVLKPKKQPEWKIYFNPRASGLCNAKNVVQQAVSFLGMPEAW